MSAECDKCGCDMLFRPGAGSFCPVCELTDKMESVATAALLALPEERRVEVMAGFCKGCGTEDPACRCEDDS